MQYKIEYRPMASLVDALDKIAQSPKQEGRVDLIVRRPAVDEREVLEVGELSEAQGLVGDNWRVKGEPVLDMQLNIMNSRVIQAICGDIINWPIAGDQFFVDFDLGAENLPAGTQLSLGDAIIEITPEPHMGCKKFTERFGVDAMKFVNSKLHREHNLRGICAKVVKSGRVAVGDSIKFIR